MTTVTHNTDISAFVLGDEDRTLRRQTLSLDPPKAHEVMVDVVACGVCHTDLHVIKDEVAFPKPGVLGHEISGVVRELGDEVTGLKVGDHVVCSFIMPCGECRHCRNGLSAICEVFFSKNRLEGRLLDGTTRLHRQNGSEVEDIAMYSMSGHATQAVIPDTAVFPISDEVPLDKAAVLGCSIFTAHGAVNDVAKVQPGESVAVIAAGGIGLSIIHLAQAAGAKNIVAIDVDDEKLALAKELGATHTVNSKSTDPGEALNEILGTGPDVVFEALGTKPTVEQALSVIGDGGRVVLAGIAPNGVNLETEITKIVRRKIQVLGSFGANPQQTMPKVIKLAEEGKIDLDKLISQYFTFDQTDEAYRLLNDRKISGRGVIDIAGNK